MAKQESIAYAESSNANRANITPPFSPLFGKVEGTASKGIIRLSPDPAVVPIPVNGKVMPCRPKNRDVRSREYLTDKEVTDLMAAARKTGRHGHRDASLILLSYRHGLRVSEAIALRWDQLDLSQGLLHVNRAKSGTPSTHIP